MEHEGGRGGREVEIGDVFEGGIHVNGAGGGGGKEKGDRLSSYIHLEQSAFGGLALVLVQPLSA